MDRNHVVTWPSRGRPRPHRDKISVGARRRIPAWAFDAAVMAACFLAGAAADRYGAAIFHAIASFVR